MSREEVFWWCWHHNYITATLIGLSIVASGELYIYLTRPRK